MWVPRVILRWSVLVESSPYLPSHLSALFPSFGAENRASVFEQAKHTITKLHSQPLVTLPVFRGCKEELEAMHIAQFSTSYSMSVCYESWEAPANWLGTQNTGPLKKGLCSINLLAEVHAVLPWMVVQTLKDSRLDSEEIFLFLIKINFMIFINHRCIVHNYITYVI